jgi:hypothetical protein
MYYCSKPLNENTYCQFLLTSNDPWSRFEIKFMGMDMSKKYAGSIDCPDKLQVFFCKYLRLLIGILFFPRFYRFMVSNLHHSIGSLTPFLNIHINIHSFFPLKRKMHQGGCSRTGSKLLFCF